MFKVTIVAFVLSLVALASVQGAVAVYRYSYPPYYPFYGLGGVVPSVPVEGSKVEAKVAEGKVDGIAPISSYLITPHYYGYSYAGYAYVPNLRFVRDADKSVEQGETKIEEPIAESSSNVRAKRSPQVVPPGNFNTQIPV